MPAPNKEAVRVLAVAVGQREAARQLGMSENSVKSICFRAKDGERVRKAVATVEARVQHPNAPVPSVALENVILTNSNRSKVAASAYAANTLEYVASLSDKESAAHDPDRALAEASNAKAVTQTAALAGSWETAASGGVTAVQINIG